MTEIWQQTYDPAGNIWLSAVIAFLPILLFFLCLTVFRLKGWLAGTLTVLSALAVALLFYQMPVSQALAATVYGFFYGLWPISWIIVAAVFLYRVSIKTGQFETIRSSILTVTADQRLQMLLVAFCFGAFLEGVAGFGAPVAITAALLVGLGFRPLYAAGLCLVANTAPVAFGALGIPVIVAAQVSGVDTMHVSAMVGRQLPFMTMIVVFALVAIMDGKRGVKETWPAVIVAGGSFAIMQYISSNFIGPELPDVLSSIVSLVALALFLKVWSPKSIFRFGADGKEILHLAPDAPELKGAVVEGLDAGKIFKAWSPYIVLTGVVIIWSLPVFKQLFAVGGPLGAWVAHIHVPFLDNLVQKMPPVVATATDYAAVYKFDWLPATGTAIFIAAVLTIIFTGMKGRDSVAIAKETAKDLVAPVYMIGTVLAFAFIANYSGLSTTIALALSQTGYVYTFFAPFLGWLGVFVTGSDTSSNALFASLQAITAQQIGVPEVLLVAANSSGGVMGKMISPQSIAVACAAVGLVGRESELVRFTLKYSLMFTAIIGIIVTLQAYVLPWMIPTI